MGLLILLALAHAIAAGVFLAALSVTLVTGWKWAQLGYVPSIAWFFWWGLLDWSAGLTLVSVACMAFTEWRSRRDRQ
jgi:hypothetical protein